MVKHVLLFGGLSGVLIAVLKLIDYRWWLVAYAAHGPTDLAGPMGIYGAVVAALFAGLGIWLGRRWTQAARPGKSTGTTTTPHDATTSAPATSAVAARTFVRDEPALTASGLTARELEVLTLMAEGLSNREIAERVHVSDNTVKTHASRVFDKLGARRRTQAVQMAKALKLIA